MTRTYACCTGRVPRQLARGRTPRRNLAARNLLWGSHEHMALLGFIGGVGLGNPVSKLLGSLGKVPYLAAGRTPEGPLSRSAALYSIGGHGFEPRQALP